jgi:hypothetical protein
LAAVPIPSEPLCEWLERGLREIAGQDPLGIQTITTDRILPALLPGVLALSRRARYFSVYAFCCVATSRTLGVRRTRDSMTSCGTASSSLASPRTSVLIAGATA